MKDDVGRELRAKDFLADIAFGVCISQRLIQHANPFSVLAANIDIRCRNAHGITCNDNAFEQQVRIKLKNLPIFERARLRFITIDTKILRLRGLLRHERPFQAGREACATPSAKTGFFYFVGYFFRLHTERFAKRLVSAVRLVDIEFV